MLGQQIKKIRKIHGLTQTQFGLRLNVGKSTVSQWENGVNEPDSETQNRICDEFGVSMDELHDRPVDPRTEREKEESGLAAMKEYRARIAAGEFTDIPEEKIPFVLYDLDNLIRNLEDDLDSQK